MKASWPIIAVEDVQKSSRWYAELLNVTETHPGRSVFNMLIAADGSTLLCLHHWGPSGAKGDKAWPTLSTRHDDVGNGLLLWFVVDDFEKAWERAQALHATVEEPNTDNGTGLPAFMLRDPDGYYVVVNRARS